MCGAFDSTHRSKISEALGGALGVYEEAPAGRQLKESMDDEWLRKDLVLASERWCGKREQGLPFQSPHNSRSFHFPTDLLGEPTGPPNNPPPGR